MEVEMTEKKNSYEKRLDYNNQYNRNNYRSFSARFDVRTEADIIAWLSAQDSVKAYLKELILQDMHKNRGDK